MIIQCESCKKEFKEKDIIWDLKEDKEVCRECYLIDNKHHGYKIYKVGNIEE